MRWETTELGNVTEVFNGKTPSKAEQRSKGNPVLKIKNLDELGNFRGFDSYIDPALHKKYSKKGVRAGDTLVLNAAHSATHVGSKICRAPKESIGALATGEWLIVRCKDEADPGFVHHWMTSDLARRQIRDAVKGIHLYPKDVARFSIPLPPLDEQRRIAGILDAADALRRRRREALALLDTLPGAIFAEMFGDRLTGTDATSRFAPLSELAHIQSGITKGRRLKEGEETEEIAYLAVVNVQDKRLDLSSVKSIEATAKERQRYALAIGDLLLTEGGDPDKLGRGTIWNNEIPGAIHQNHIFRVRVTDEKVQPIFLSHLLSSPYGRGYFLRMAKQTTGIASINKTQLSEFPVILPPEVQQIEFVQRLKSYEDQKERQISHLSEIETLFASLQSRAFAGEL